MKNPELLASIILSDDIDRAEKLSLYKNICYFTDSDSNPIKLTIDGKYYKLAIDFPTATDHYITIKLLATGAIVNTTDSLESVTYRVHQNIRYNSLVKWLKLLPNHAYLILKAEAK